MLYCEPIQLIYRGRLKVNILNLIKYVKWLREGCTVNERFPKKRKNGKIGKYRYNCFLGMVRGVPDSLITLFIGLQSYWLHLISYFSLFPYPFLEESIFLIQLPRMHLSPSLGQSPFLIRMLVPSIGVAKSNTTREPNKANPFINKSWFET